MTPVLFHWPIGATAADRSRAGVPTGWYVAMGWDGEYVVNGRPAVHPGLDLSDIRGGDSDLGAPVYAAAAGVVVASLYSPESWGNIIMVRHDDVPGYGTLWSQYAHLNARAVGVGDHVTRGQVLGGVGKGAGDRFAAHLHFEIRKVFMAASAWPGNNHAKVALGYINPLDVLGREIG